MTPDEESPETPLERAQWFATTHWSVVLEARGKELPGAEAALEQLCRTYWKPLYYFVHGQGYDEETAKDLTQGLFARFLEKNYLADVKREKGKFRSFLLALLKHFLGEEGKKSRAQKRGGGKIIESFDALTDADRDRLGPVDKMDPEKLFILNWALTLIDTVQQRLREDFRIRGNSDRYDRLAVYLSGDKNGPPYAEVATRLGLSESGVKTAVERMRERFGEFVRAEVAKTVSSPAEVDEEIRYLLSVISG